MFCPPAVRERYAKKYGMKRVEEYERHMMLQQSSNKKSSTRISLRNFVKGRKMKKNKSKNDLLLLKNSNTDLTNSVESNYSVVFWANSNGMDFDDPKMNMAKKQSLNSNPMIRDNDHIDEKYLDDEFDAYGSDSSSSSEEVDDNNEEALYADSSDDSDNDDNNAISSNKKNKMSHKKNDLWSMPNDKAIQQLQNKYTKATPNQSTNQSPSNNTKSPPQQQQQSIQNNVVGIFVTAFQGMNLFSPDFFHDKTLNSKVSTPSHSRNSNNNKSSASTSSKQQQNNNIITPTRMSLQQQSPQRHNANNNNEDEKNRFEQQKRAAELVAALGLFDDTYTTTYDDQQHTNDYNIASSSPSCTSSPPNITRIIATSSSSYSSTNQPLKSSPSPSSPEKQQILSVQQQQHQNQFIFGHRNISPYETIDRHHTNDGFITSKSPSPSFTSSPTPNIAKIVPSSPSNHNSIQLKSSSTSSEQHEQQQKSSPVSQQNSTSFLRGGNVSTFSPVVEPSTQISINTNNYNDNASLLDDSEGAIDELDISELTVSRRLIERTIAVPKDGQYIERTIAVPKNDQYYYGGKYEDNGKDEDISIDYGRREKVESSIDYVKENNEDDDDDDDLVAAAAIDDDNNLAITPQALSFERAIGTNNKNTSNNNPFSGMNISILAKSSTALPSMDDRTTKSEPSPKQKRMLVNHYTQMKRHGRKSVPIVHDNQQQDDDEIVDLELLEADRSDSHHDDESSYNSDDDHHDMEEEKLEDGTIAKKIKGSVGSGVSHIGANIFIDSEKQSKYYGSLHNSCGVLYTRRRRNNRRTNNHRNQHQHSSSASSTSRILGASYTNNLYNIDEDSVVDEDDVINGTINTNNDTNMVNRLMLRNSGMWKDDKGKVIMNQHGQFTANNTIPDFKPRYEEDDNNDDDGGGGSIVQTIIPFHPNNINSNIILASSIQFQDDNDRLNSQQPTTLTHTNSTDDDCTMKTTSSSSSSTQQQHLSTPRSPSRLLTTTAPSSSSSSQQTPTKGTTFCFGGIQLLSPTLFQSMEIQQEHNKTVNYSANYQRVSGSSSTATNSSNNNIIDSSASVVTDSGSISRMNGSPKKLMLSSQLSSMVHPMKREYFTTTTTVIETGDAQKDDESTPKKTPIEKNYEPNNFKKVKNTDDYKKRIETKNDDIVSPTTKKSGTLDNDTLLLNMEQYKIIGKSPNKDRRSRLSSSFRSTAHKDKNVGKDGNSNNSSDSPSNNGRVTYKLGSGKKAMSKDDLVRLQELLPNRTEFPEIVSPNKKEAIPQQQDDNNVSTLSPLKDSSNDSPPKESMITLGESKKRLLSSLSTSASSPRRFQSPFDTKSRRIAILLIEPIQKIFEVVFLDSAINLRELTVGDALAKARSNAIDSTLSEQKYISLCNEQQEIAAPMLAVDFLLKPTSSKNKKADHIDHNNKKNDKHRTVLLVAVPQGYTAVQMQKIKKLLWKNPKTARWWKQNDPLQPDQKPKRKSSSSSSSSSIKEDSILIGKLVQSKSYSSLVSIAANSSINDDGIKHTKSASAPTTPTNVTKSVTTINTALLLTSENYLAPPKGRTFTF